MRRIASGLVAVITAGLVTVLTARAEAASANTTVSLPLQNFTAIAAAANKIYLVGSDTTSVVVRNSDGTADTQIDLGSSPAALAVSEDGSHVYVALPNAGEIAVIDTATDLAEATSYDIGASTCPSTLAVVGTSIWFGYGCTNGSAAIGVVDPTQDPASITLAVVSSLGTAPLLVASPAFPDRIFTAVQYSPTDLVAYDVSGATLTQKASVQVDGITQMAITSDGNDLVTANGSPYDHPRYLTSDLSTDGQYTTNPYPNAVATGQNGLVAAGVAGDYVPDIYVFDASQGLIRNYDFGTCCSQGDSDLLAPRGLVFVGNVLYAVTEDYLGQTIELRVLTNAAQYVSQVHLSAPATAKRAEPLAVTGSLTGHGGAIANATVHVSKTDLDGKHTLSNVVTSGTGAFTIHDTPRVGGTNTYTVSYAGDTTHGAVTKSIRVSVSRATVAMTVTPGKSVYNYGATEWVTVHLGKTYSNRKVSIYARQNGGTQIFLRTANVNSSGNLSAAVKYNYNFVFIAKFAGDERYAPLTATVHCKVRVAISSALAGFYAKSGAYHLFHQTHAAGFAIGVVPNKAGESATLVLQKEINGSWRTISRLFGTLDSNSVLAGAFRGYTNTNYRVQGVFHGDSYNAGNASKWWYCRFT